MAGTYSFEEAGGKNPYDTYVFYAEIGKNTERFVSRHQESGTPPTTLFKMLSATRKYLFEKEQAGQEFKRSDFDSDFADFYVTGNDDPMHYASFFRLLFAGGYSLLDIEDYMIEQTEKLDEINQSKFTDVVNDALKIFKLKLESN